MLQFLAFFSVQLSHHGLFGGDHLYSTFVAKNVKDNEKVMEPLFYPFLLSCLKCETHNSNMFTFPTLLFIIPESWFHFFLSTTTFIFSIGLKWKMKNLFDLLYGKESYIRSTMNLFIFKSCQAPLCFCFFSLDWFALFSFFLWLTLVVVGIVLVSFCNDILARGHGL